MRHKFRFLLCIFLLYSVFSIAQTACQYDGLVPDVFLRCWRISDPIAVDADTARAAQEQTQLAAFKNDAAAPDKIVQSALTGILDLNGHTYGWRIVESITDIIDLVKAFGEKEYVYVFAQAEIVMPEDKKVLLGIGSDDGVKMWVNGKLAHENWVGRPVSADDDLVPVTLQKGSNQILFKVQNMQMGWGFTCRMLSPESLKERLIFTTRMGNIEAVEMLLDFGVDPNTSVGPGLYAYHAAKMSGRDELAELLISRGADDSVPAPAVEKLVDYVVQRAIKENTPGAAVLVARDGKILLQKGYGLADVGKKIPVAPKTTFRIGSITKQFTASAILKLQEEGKLSVEDPLSKYVPDFPRGDQVTIHHLLTHISGIHSFTSTDDFLNKVLNEITTQEMIETIKGLDYDFDPGETWLYNNSGFFLLGYIVEKVSGLDFDTFLKKKFFIPLEMENTGVYSKDVKFDAEATGYSYENDSIKVALDWDMSHAGGAGNLYSNVINLYKWNEGVFNGRVLSETSLKAALTPVKLNNGQEADVGSGAHYGYGWGISIWRGLREISHGGGLHGFSTVLTRFPEKNTTVIVLSNCAPALPGFAAGQVAHDISEIFLWQEMEKQESYRAATNVNYAVYDDYVGQYDYKSAILTVTRDGEHLYAQLSGQARYEIFPRSENEFFWKITDAQATFIRDENGVVTHVVHHQGGATFDAPRMEQRKIVKLDPSLYEKYIGEYQLQAGIKISISAENDRIFLQVTGQPKVELFPESETAFFLKVVNAQVDFIAGQTGKATELILHQAGMDMPAKRVEME